MLFIRNNYLRKHTPLFTLFLLIIFIYSCGSDVDNQDPTTPQVPVSQDSKNNVTETDNNPNNSESILSDVELKVSDLTSTDISKSSDIGPLADWNTITDYYTNNSNFNIRAECSVDKYKTPYLREIPFKLSLQDSSSLKFDTTSFSDNEVQATSSSVKTIDKDAIDLWETWISFLEKYPQIFPQQLSTVSLGDKSYNTITFSNIPASFVLFFMKTFYFSDESFPQIQDTDLVNIQSHQTINDYMAYAYIMYDLVGTRENMNSSSVEQSLAHKREIQNATRNLQKLTQQVNDLTVQAEEATQKAEEATQKAEEANDKAILAFEDGKKEAEAAFQIKQDELNERIDQITKSSDEVLKKYQQALDKAQAEINAQNNLITQLRNQPQPQPAPQPQPSREHKSDPIQTILDPLDLRDKLPSFRFSTNKSIIPRAKSSKPKLSHNSSIPFITEKDLKNLLADKSNFIAKDKNEDFIQYASYEIPSTSDDQDIYSDNDLYSSEFPTSSDEIIFDIDNILQQIQNTEFTKYYSYIEKGQSSGGVMLFNIDNSIFKTSITIIKDNLIPIEMSVEANHSNKYCPKLKLSLEK